MPSMRNWWRDFVGSKESAPPQGSGNVIDFQDAYALVVGVGADLPNTVDDARGLYDVLVDPGRCGYAPGHVRLLTGPEATRQAVVAGLKWLAAETTGNSTVIVYFSGHGVRRGLGDDFRYHLMPFGYDLGDLQRTAIDDQEFARLIRAVPTGKLLLLLDCCHAGGIDPIKSPGFEKASPAASAEVLAAGEGRYLIASSRANEVSLAGRPHSAFTAALLEVLCGKEASVPDGFVRAADLMAYTYAAVTRRTNDRQHPMANFSKADNFVVSFYAGGELEPKALPFDSLEVEGPQGQFAAAPALVLQSGWQVDAVNNLTSQSGPITVNIYQAPRRVDPVADPRWGRLRQELSSMEAAGAYRNVKPLLERARYLVEAGQQPQVASDFLVLAQVLNKEFENGAVLQPGWNVNTVVQAAKVDLNLEMAPLRAALEEIGAALRPKQQVIPVDIVPLIMTAEEADSLVSGAAFSASQQVLQQDFAMLAACLDGLGLPDWRRHYGNRRQDWRPFEDKRPDAPTIAQHIETRLRDIARNDRLAKQLSPVVHDVANLGRDEALLKQLRRDGCIVLIDSLSLRHPKLLAALQRTLLDVFPRCSVFTFAPDRGALQLLEEMTHALQVTLRDSELRRRVQDPLQEFPCVDLIRTNEPLYGWALVNSVRKLYGEKAAVVGGVDQYFNNLSPS